MLIIKELHVLPSRTSNELQNFIYTIKKANKINGIVNVANADYY